MINEPMIKWTIDYKWNKLEFSLENFYLEKNWVSKETFKSGKVSPGRIERIHPLKWKQTWFCYILLLDTSLISGVSFRSRGSWREDPWWLLSALTISPSPNPSMWRTKPVTAHLPTILIQSQKGIGIIIMFDGWLKCCINVANLFEPTI